MTSTPAEALVTFMIWVTMFLRLLFGVVFIYAGALKALDPGLFLLDVRSFDLLPDPYAAWVAMGLPWLEILAGLAIVTGFFRMGGLVILNAALLGFLVAIAISWWRGIDIRCGCFGSSDAVSDYLELIVRDLLLLGLGLFLLLRDRSATKLPA